jgi:hypothetical protein
LRPRPDVIVIKPLPPLGLEEGVFDPIAEHGHSLSATAPVYMGALGSYSSLYEDQYTWESDHAWDILHSEFAETSCAAKWMCADTPSFVPAARMTEDYLDELMDEMALSAALRSDMDPPCCLKSFAIRGDDTSSSGEHSPDINEHQKLVESTFAADQKIMGGVAGDQVETERILDLEKRLTKAIEAIISFKELSCEPWKAFHDKEEFLTSARHFANVARTLPDWDLDDLGRALNLRGIIASGRTMPRSDHVTVEQFQAALAKSAREVDNNMLEEAWCFYSEIGHFPHL